MWLWSLGPGESYRAEPDPQGWHEMIFVIDGVLELVLSDDVQSYAAGSYAVYSTAQTYAYANPGPRAVRFIRNVIS